MTAEERFDKAIAMTNKALGDDGIRFGLTSVQVQQIFNSALYELLNDERLSFQKDREQAKARMQGKTR